MLGPPGNLDSLSGRSNFGRPDRMSMGVPDRGPLRNRDFAPSPPREMRRDYRNESHDYERSGLLPHDYDSYRNYGPPDFPGSTSGNYSFYGPSSTNAHFNYMHDQKMPAEEPGGYAIPFHGTNNANDLYPSPQIAYHLALNKLPTKRKAQAQPFSCNVCNVNFNSEQQAAQHFSSVRHVKKMRMMEPGSKSLDGKESELDASLGNKNALSKKQVFTCECCKITVNSLHQLEAHKSGSKHQTKMSQMDPNNPQMETEDDPAGGSDNNSQNASFDKKTVYTCSYCNVTVNSLQQLEAHKSGSKHQAKVQPGGGDPSPKQMEMDEDTVGGDMNNLPLLASFDKKAVFTCEYCKITVNSLHQLEAHKNGSKHQSKVSQMEPGKQMENNNLAALSSPFDKKAVFTCDCCNVTVNSLQQLEAHKIGSKHQAKVQQPDPSKQMEANFVSAINNLKLPPSSEVKQSFTCVYCNISVNSLQQLEAHMSGSKHQAKLQKAQEEK